MSGRRLRELSAFLELHSAIRWIGAPPQDVSHSSGDRYLVQLTSEPAPGPRLNDCFTPVSVRYRRGARLAPIAPSSRRPLCLFWRHEQVQRRAAAAIEFMR